MNIFYLFILFFLIFFHAASLERFFLPGFGRQEQGFLEFQDSSVMLIFNPEVFSPPL